MYGEKFLIGKPRVYPHQLVEELKKIFLTIPEIKSAYLAQIFLLNSHEVLRPVIGIDMDAQIDNIIEKLRLSIEKSFKQDEYIDFFHKNTKGLSEYFSKIPPFYIRPSDKIP